MFTKFEAIAMPDRFQIVGATRFSIAVNVDGKEYHSEAVVQNESLVHEGYIDHFFRQFVAQFKEGVGAQMNKEESQAQHITGPSQNLQS